MNKLMVVVLSMAFCVLTGCSGSGSPSALAKDIEAHSNFKNVRVVKILQKHPDRSGAYVGTTYVVEAEVTKVQFGAVHISETKRFAVFVANGESDADSVSQL